MVEILEIELDEEGVGELLKSAEVMEFLEKQADKIIKRASKDSGSNYEKSVYPNGRTRGNVSIYTADKNTYFRNLHNNEILQAL